MAELGVSTISKLPWIKKYCMKKLSHLMKMKLKCFSQMKNRYLHLQRGLTYKLDKNNENVKEPAYSFVRIANKSEYPVLSPLAAFG